MLNYSFVCCNCNTLSYIESFSLKPSSFAQMCVTALANLTFANAKNGKLAFSKDKDIIPYIDVQWEALTSMSKRGKSSWHQSVVKTLSRETDYFVRISNGKASSSYDSWFSLKEKDLSKIGPKQIQLIEEAMSQSQQAKRIRSQSVKEESIDENSIDSSDQQQIDTVAFSPNNGDIFTAPANMPSKTRGGAKRKCTEQQPNSVGMKKAKSEPNSLVKLAPSQVYPTEHPFNRDGYRYFLAESDAHAPFRQEFDDSYETAGKPIPPYMYRVFRPGVVTLSPNDRAPQLKLTEDRLQVTGEKGYSVIRATHGVSEGAYFYEVKFLDQPEPSHARIGWSQSLGCLQAPVGYDKFSYSWRSRKGTFFHDSNGKHYCQGGYKKGDTLGFYIFLPHETKIISRGRYGNFAYNAVDRLPQSYKDLPLIKFKSYFYYEEKDEVEEALKNVRSMNGSKMICFKNGIDQGVAMQDFSAGIFYPAISLYKNATVRVNFGPKFEFEPKDLAYQPMSDRADELIVEQTVADLIFFIENDGKLTLDS